VRFVAYFLSKSSEADEADDTSLRFRTLLEFDVDRDGEEDLDDGEIAADATFDDDLTDDEVAA
jgi:hypothetical protein